ncbi:DUF2520 domain-containing protein [Nonlabens sp.]|uniref:Rossmann-like and DUF2520 domain-containing protein n=1 Tax=Nonlabens sp. TaxID=1888209 RepID=UPI00326332C2
MIKIIIIGTGNVGMHLCHAFEKAALTDKISLTGYYNRGQKKLSDINAPLFSQIENLPACDLIILAVPDDSIEATANQLPTSQAIIVHTSGSVSITALEKHEHHGVFYLPQSFSKIRKPNFGDITLCLESNSEAVNDVLEQVAVTLSRKREQINSNQRKKLHLAAVYMNNFVNHCYTKADEIMQDADMDTQLLNALMQETLAKAIDLSPQKAQTGPAMRNDIKTIEKHLEMLENEDRDMYRSITNSIQKTHGN